MKRLLIGGLRAGGLTAVLVALPQGGMGKLDSKEWGDARQLEASRDVAAQFEKQKGFRDPGSLSDGELSAAEERIANGTADINDYELQDEINRRKKESRGSEKTADVKIGVNTRKMSPEEVTDLLGPKWHQNGAKPKFVRDFKDKLKGDKNPDFYIDVKTKEVYLRSLNTNIWVPTGKKFE